MAGLVSGTFIGVRRAGAADLEPGAWISLPFSSESMLFILGLRDSVRGGSSGGGEAGWRLVGSGDTGGVFSGGGGKAKEVSGASGWKGGGGISSKVAISGWGLRRTEGCDNIEALFGATGMAPTVNCGCFSRKKLGAASG